MEEIARITKIEGTRITVKGGELGGCFGCMNQECKDNGNTFVAEDRTGAELEVGQLVEVRSSDAATAGQAALVFLPPFVLAAAGYAAAAALLPASAEAGRAAVAVGGLLVGFLGVYAYRRAFPAKAVPELVRVVEEKDAPGLSDGIEAVAETEPEDGGF